MLIEKGNNATMLAGIKVIQCCNGSDRMKHLIIRSVYRCPVFAIPKLPAPREDDLSQGILETIDLESYRNEARDSVAIKLEDADGEVGPVPTGKSGHIDEPDMDLLSAILSDFNDMFGNINWNDADRFSKSLPWCPGMSGIRMPCGILTNRVRAWRANVPYSM